jgi:hypothetical protein
LPDASGYAMINCLLTIIFKYHLRNRSWRVFHLTGGDNVLLQKAAISIQKAVLILPFGVIELSII